MLNSSRKMQAAKQKLSFFEIISSCLSRKILKENRSNSNSLPNAEKRSKIRDEISSILKEALYNSVSQALIKIFNTSHFTLKLALSFFVLITISTRYYKYYILRLKCCESSHKLPWVISFYLVDDLTIPIFMSLINKG